MSKVCPLIALTAVFASSSTASASVHFDAVTDDVGGGLTRYLFMAHSTVPSALIGGFEAVFTTVSPVMNQINLAGSATIFANDNGLSPWVGEVSSQDSQYQVVSSGLLNAPGNTVESSTLPKTTFMFPAGSVCSPARDISFAQPTVPRGAAVNYEGFVSHVNTGGQMDYISGVIIPEPNTVVLMGTCYQLFLYRNRH